MLDDKIRFKLHCGPYKPHDCKVGDTLTCAVRGKMTVCGFSDGPIRWPMGRRGKQKNCCLVVCGELKRAVEHEAGIAVAHWWGVCRQVVWRWRRKLGITSNIGTQRLRVKALGDDADRVQKLLASRGAVPLKSHKGKPTLVGLAEKHVADNRLRGRTPIHSCSRFSLLSGILNPDDVTTEAIEHFRDYCAELGYAPRTIEGGISDVLLIVKHCGGRVVSPGKRLRKRRPVPQPATLDHISAVFEVSPVWVQQWLALSFWTGLRLHDSLELMRQFEDGRQRPHDTFTWEASKTGHVHQYPCPSWLTAILSQPAKVPFGEAHCHLQDKLRDALTEASEAANVERLLPKYVRQSGLTEWAAADGMAGSIIHGSGLGVLNHYIDPLSVLKRHQHRVQLPTAFAPDAGDDIAFDFAGKYESLSAESQAVIRHTMDVLQSAAG